MSLDLGVAASDLALKSIVDLEVLLEDKQMLGTVVSGECCCDLGLGSLTPRIAMQRETGGVRLPVHDVAQDSQAGGAADVADHDVQL